MSLCSECTHAPAPFQTTRRITFSRFAEKSSRSALLRALEPGAGGGAATVRVGTIRFPNAELVYMRGEEYRVIVSIPSFSRLE